jgi:uncharacterized OsmC-like protein
MTVIKPVQRNGLRLEILEGIASAVGAEPQAGSVTIRTRHRWDDGLAVDGEAHDIESAGEVTARTFTFRTDWPSDVGGRDTGPAPGEVLLGALGGCIGMTYVLHAAMQGVEIAELDIAIEAGWDVRGLFELDGAAPAGLSNVAVVISVRADATREDLERIGALTARTSAVFNSLAHPTPIELSVRRI